MQKLSPNRYPYKFEVIDEREFLVMAPTVDGAEYIASKGMEFRNVRLERRPIYVVKLTQLDPSYVYGHRIFYIDKETFLYYHVENYDRKGRLYRTWDGNYGWMPEMGDLNWCGTLHPYEGPYRHALERRAALPAPCGMDPGGRQHRRLHEGKVARIRKREAGQPKGLSGLALKGMNDRRPIMLLKDKSRDYYRRDKGYRERNRAEIRGGRMFDSNRGYYKRGFGRDHQRDLG